ncbi:NTP transferase domain-containing protein [Candidatus Dependentiae bacterium]|nr:NTP transferase domain-containing protein [Candidatus Dependentiae bacterium]
MNHLQAIILAGKTSERLLTNQTKLTEKICGKEMIVYPLQLLKKLKIPSTLVIGYQLEQIKKILESYNHSSVSIVHQQESLGSGHALFLTKSFWQKEHILLMNADMPLLTEEVIINLYNTHLKTNADLSFITAHGMDVENKNYCRIVIDNNKIQVLKKTDSIQDNENQCCISGGVYIAKRSFLETYIDSLTKNNQDHEYHLPELVQIASDHHHKIVTSPVSIDSIRCVDTLADLWAIEHIKRSQIIRHWMEHGVRIANALSVMIDESVIIEPGAFIDSGVHLLGKTEIKKNSIIGAYSCITNSIIDMNCTIKSHVVIANSTIAAHTIIPPFSHINKQNDPASTLEEETNQTFTGAIKTKYINNSQNI